MAKNWNNLEILSLWDNNYTQKEIDNIVNNFLKELSEVSLYGKSQRKNIYNIMMKNSNKRLILPFKNYDYMSKDEILNLCYFLVFGIYGKPLSVNLYRSLMQYSRCFKENRELFLTCLMFVCFEIPFDVGMLNQALELEKEMNLEPVFKA